jgi:hypothetical protein
LVVSRLYEERVEKPAAPILPLVKPEVVGGTVL